MTDQISNLTKQSFPEICRNNGSLNETVSTLKCDTLHVFDMVDELKRKKFVNWIISLHVTKFFEAKGNSFCTIINQDKYSANSALRKTNLQASLFSKIRHSLCCGEINYFDRLDWLPFSERKRVNQSCMSKWFIFPNTHLHVNTLTHGSFIISLPNKHWKVICRGGQQILTTHLL